MSTTNTTGFKTFITAEKIPLGRRVVISGANEVSLADATELGIGATITSNDVDSDGIQNAASGTQVTVQLFSQGSIELQANSASTPNAGSPAYTAAAGFVSGTAPSPVVIVGTFNETGTALELASLEVIPTFGN